jgi:hypothetical protein
MRIDMNNVGLNKRKERPMANIPKKVVDRFIKSVPRFQKVLQIARDRDVNESDTVAVLNDIFGEVFGYAKYLEVTSEFAIRSTFCDLALKVDDKVQFLVEVKAIGIELKDDEKDQEFLFLLAKEGLGKNAREHFYEKVQSVNRYVIGNLMLAEPVLAAVRRELKKLADGMKIDVEEVEQIVRAEVLKREIVEGEEAEAAQARVRKFYRKGTVPHHRKKKQAEPPLAVPPVPEESVTDKLLREAQEQEASQQSHPGDA